MLPHRTDLFTTPPPSEPAPCGFIPTLGWSGKFQHDWHQTVCDKCISLGKEAATKNVGEPTS